MGFFDKLTDKAKQLGEKLTSEETKEAVKSGAAKAGAGLSSGFRKLKDKISDAPKMELSEIFDILLDDDAGESRWRAAYAAAKVMNLKESDIADWYIVDAVAIWREVSDSSGDANMSRAFVLATYEAFMCDSSEPMDMTYRIMDDLPDMMETVFDYVHDDPDKDYYDAFFLVGAYMDGIGTDCDYWRALITVDLALVLSEELGGDMQADNDSAVMSLKNICEKRVAEFGTQFDTLMDNAAGEDAWQEATDAIVGMSGLDNLLYASLAIMIKRGTLEESEKVSLIDAVVDSTYLALCRGEPLCEYTLELHTRMSRVMPDTYAAIITNMISSKENRAYAFIACAYLYGWGVTSDSYKAKAYATKLDALARSEDGFENDIDTAKLIMEFIEQA